MKALKRRAVPPSAPRAVEPRRAERELFFWTAREALKLIVLAAMTAYFVISLISGHFAGITEVLNLVAHILELLG